MTRVLFFGSVGFLCGLAVGTLFSALLDLGWM